MVSKEVNDKILSEIKKTEKLILEYKDLSKPVAPDCAIGRISRMDAINNKSINEAALRRSEKKIKELKRVLSNIKSESFGLCLRCKNPIPIQRILVMPESLYCVNCVR